MSEACICLKLTATNLGLAETNLYNKQIGVSAGASLLSMLAVCQVQAYSLALLLLLRRFAGQTDLVL